MGAMALTLKESIMWGSVMSLKRDSLPNPAVIIKVSMSCRSLKIE